MPSRLIPFLALSLLGFPVCQALAASPAFEITTIPPYGSLPGRIEGRVPGVIPANYRIAALIFLPDLGYFSKPYCTATTTALESDGSFSVLFTTGGIDELATRITLLLVPASADVPCYTAVAGIPAELEALATSRIDLRRPNPAQLVFEFAAGDWLVKASDAPVGPGPNRFSGSTDNVWVDGQGRLHLRITFRDGRWYCAEVISRRIVGYGVYQFTLDTPPGLDPNIVFGAFTWTEGARDNREIDALEIGRLGRPADGTNAQYVVQPWDQPGHLLRLNLPDARPTTYVMRWEPNRVVFQSYLGEDAVESLKINEWAFGGASPAAGSVDTNFRFNLWLYNQPPSDGSEAEVVVKSFRYEPLLGPAAQPEPAAVVDAASFQPAGARGGLIAVFGNGLATQTAVPTGLPLPNGLAGVSVSVDGLPAPLLYVSPTQINAQVPYLAPLGPALVAVQMGESSGAAPFWLGAAAPAFFINPPNFCLAQNQDFKLNTTAFPAPQGSVIFTYLTGIGDVLPAVASGAAALVDPLSRPVLPAWATLGGQDARLESLGLAPQLVGVAQASIGVPSGLEPGVHPLIIRVGDAESSACLIAVGSQPVTAAAPVIRSVSPQSARAGEQVVISGAGFQPNAVALFGNTTAGRTTYADPQTLRTTTPAGFGTVSVTVRNPDRQQATLPNAFTFISPAPAVVKVTPGSGSTSGGTAVAIAGNNFQSGAKVDFGPNLAALVQWIDANTLQATSPPGSGVVNIAVTNPDGQQGTLSNAFTFISPAPAVLKVTPGSGPASGGTGVTIAGSNFQSGAKVYFGPNLAALVQWIDANTLQATSPPGSGVVSITVTNPDGQQATLAHAFTFISPAPAVAKVTPGSGPASGATPVTIAGNNFQSGARVYFGPNLAALVQWIDANTLRATSPPGSGVVSITVTNPDGQQATLANAFTFISPAPAILKVTPGSGPASGGTVVTIAGSSFQSGATVYFGANLAALVQWIDGNTLLATSPPGGGVVNIAVTNPDGQQATLANAFTFIAPAPAVLKVTPGSGSASGGTAVIIAGNKFQSGAKAYFGPNLAALVQWIDANTLQATSPPGSGVVNIAVTNPDGQQGTLSNAFTYSPVVFQPSISAQVRGCTVSGSVSGVYPPGAWRVLVWARTNQFYIQPCATEKAQAIRADATWGPVDSHSGEIWVQLVREGYLPPDTTGALPGVDSTNVLAVSGPVGTVSGCDVARCPAQ